VQSPEFKSQYCKKKKKKVFQIGREKKVTGVGVEVVRGQQERIEGRIAMTQE
jgi:hypothetical protein